MSVKRSPNSECNCHFYRNGWYGFYKQVGNETLEAYLAAHPEVAESPDAPAGEQEDREFGI